MFLLWEVDPTVHLLYDVGLYQIAGVVASMLLGADLANLYTEVRTRFRVVLLQRWILAIGMAFLCQGLISLIKPEYQMPISVMVCGGAFALVALVAWRSLYEKRLIGTMGTQTCLFLGWSEDAAAMQFFVQRRPELGIAIVGCVADRPPQAPGAAVLGPVDHLWDIAAKSQPDRIVINYADRRGHLPLGVLMQLQRAGVVVEELPAFYESVFLQLPVQQLRPSELAFEEWLSPSTGRVVRQWVFSMALTLPLALLALPIFLLSALGVKLTSRGALFRASRCVGLRGMSFPLYEFRCEYVDGPRAGQPTSVGRLLVRLHLCKLPWLINLFRGDLNFVGPAPERVEFVAVLASEIPPFTYRHSVKPGLTGWAQIHRDAMDIDTLHNLEFDLYYAKHVSQTLDTYIVLQALKRAAGYI
jgi:lipopolysaccharide/colanic/teichoic acid biosynthesis glycosyltransferase